MKGGRYRLVREIARGGMGAVWLAHDEVLGREVAIKRIGRRGDADPAAIERAEREAKLSARLNHPNVVAVFDLVPEDDETWLVMEYVSGTSLSQHLKEHGPMSPDQTARVLKQVAEGLAAAHLNGVVHRDVKPSNILLAETGEAKLSDFGIARGFTDPSLTATGMVTGSPAYIAPEVASGRTTTAAADMWSLGATMFHALTGHPPYDFGDNLMGSLYRLVHEDPPRVANPGWLGPVLDHTMVRDPEDRWDAQEVIEFLSRRQASSPAITAKPSAKREPDPSPTHVLGTKQPTNPRAQAAPSPRRGRVAVLAAIALLLLALLGWAAMQLLTGPASDRADNAPPNSTVTPSGSPSSTPTPSPPGPDPDAMSAFATTYVDEAANDPKTAWPRLTREFQKSSGGYGQYKKFWDKVASVEVSNVSADPEQLTVSYSATYVFVKGFTMRDDVTLHLISQGDTFKISGEG